MTGSGRERVFVDAVHIHSENWSFFSVGERINHILCSVAVILCICFVCVHQDVVLFYILLTMLCSMLLLFLLCAYVHMYACTLIPSYCYVMYTTCVLNGCKNFSHLLLV